MNERPQKNCVHGQYYSYPNSCTSFSICVNGNLISQQCGPGLNWNKEKNMCDWAFKNPCIEKPKKTAPLTATDIKSMVTYHSVITCWNYKGLHFFLFSFSHALLKATPAFQAIAKVSRHVYGVGMRCSVALLDSTLIRGLVYATGRPEPIVRTTLCRQTSKIQAINQFVHRALRNLGKRQRPRKQQPPCHRPWYILKKFLRCPGITK